MVLVRDNMWFWSKIIYGSGLSIMNRPEHDYNITPAITIIPLLIPYLYHTTTYTIAYTITYTISITHRLTPYKRMC